jgi:hypothetical protein
MLNTELEKPADAVPVVAESKQAKPESPAAEAKEEAPKAIVEDVKAPQPPASEGTKTPAEEQVNKAPANTEIVENDRGTASKESVPEDQPSRS